VLNTNQPFNAIRLPLVRIFRVLSSSACSLICFLNVTFSLLASSKARVIRSVKRFAGDGRSRQALIVEFSSAFVCRSSVPSGGELSSKDKSRSVCWGGVFGGEAAEVRLSVGLSTVNH
jgi:hypothetical protein